MACLPGGPQNPVRNVGKVRAWAPEPTKLEKWWLLSNRIWLRKSLLMNAMFKRRLGTYIVVLDFSKEGLSQLLSSSHNCRPWQSTAKGGEENGEMGGDRHTESGDSGFRSGLPSLKLCFETWSKSFIVYCHSHISAGNTPNSRKLLLLLSSQTGWLSSFVLTIVGPAKGQLTYLANVCVQYLLVVCVYLRRACSLCVVFYVSKSRDLVCLTLSTLPS